MPSLFKGNRRDDIIYNMHVRQSTLPLPLFDEIIIVD